MRRFGGAIALLVISFPLIEPLLFSGPESNLPACCRRDGKHKCTMMMARAQHKEAAGPQFSASTDPCPLFPRAALSTANGRFDLPTPIPFRAIVLADNELFASPQKTDHGGNAVEMVRKRGPPSFV